MKRKKIKVTAKTILIYKKAVNGSKTSLGNTEPTTLTLTTTTHTTGIFGG